MRAVNLLGMLILGIAGIVLAPTVTTGQFQPGSYGKGGGKIGGGGKMPGGFGGGMQQDPGAMFDYLAKGRQFFLISETRMLNAPLTQFAQERGISNGQISRQAYLEFNDWRAKQMAAGGGGFPQKGGNFGGKNGEMQPLPAGNNPQQAPSGDAILMLAEAEFKKRDINGDGKLIPEEMNDRLRGNMSRWDTNGDRLIDFNEFKEYVANRNQGNEQSNTAAAIIIEDEDLDRKPVVFRVGGKTPGGLPSWFKELDTDVDGQVALYEWRRASKSMDEFTNWDLNGDGFITPEEAIRQQTVLAKTSKSPGSMAFGGGEEGDGSSKFSKGDFGKGKGGKGERPSFGGERPSFGGERPTFGGNPFAPPGTGGSDYGKKSKNGKKNGGN